MGAARFNPVAGFAQDGWRFRTVFIVGILGVAGLANNQFRAARLALDKGLFDDARAHISNCLKAWPSILTT